MYDEQARGYAIVALAFGQVLGMKRNMITHEWHCAFPTPQGGGILAGNMLAGSDAIRNLEPLRWKVSEFMPVYG